MDEEKKTLKIDLILVLQSNAPNMKLISVSRKKKVRKTVQFLIMAIFKGHNSSKNRLIGIIFELDL
jgi:hypothetical protein